MIPSLDQARQLGAVFLRLARNRVVVRLIGLPEIGGVGVRNRALRAHPVERGAGIEAAGKGKEGVRRTYLCGTSPMSGAS